MKSKALIAKTHPTEYLIHKYWARKPHNILAQYIDNYFKGGDTVLDPFCGSGVFLAEAKKREVNIIGFDINPIAFLLTDTTVTPPDIESFKKEAEKIINYAKDKYSNWYLIDTKEPIRYVVHEVQAKCKHCHNIGTRSKTEKKGNKYYCIKCGNRVSFNFENLFDTEIIKVIDKNNKQYTDNKTINKQKELSKNFNPIGEFNKKLIVNRRILSFPNMRLSDLFTPRAYSILSDLFNEAHKIEDEKTKRAILLLLTSSIAQCSRLIPYRNNLSTGGPAWTVPGFWLAPTHLETNPIIHLEARYKKFINGLSALDINYKNNKNHKTKISLVPAQEGIRAIRNGTLDGIFFDPPYGDNVPYVEFSEIWNSFLKYEIKYNEEIVVSDRKEFISSWDKYTNAIEEIVNLFYKKLKKEGKIIMTFNNLDPRAWRIVLGAFRDQKFHCIEARYQIPAVVSSKAQMASNTSYIGDYYCVFEKTEKPIKVNNNLYNLTERLKPVFYSRNGLVPQNLINRIAILTILNQNMDLDFLSKIEEAIIPIATKKDNGYYLLRDELNDKRLNKQYNLKNIVESVASDQLQNGKKSMEDLYRIITEETEIIGSPPVSEVKIILKNLVYFDKNYCYLQNNSESQAKLF